MDTWAPVGTRETIEDRFAAHVHPGRVATFRGFGIELVMGEREGGRFQDAFSGRWFWNCHSNGGVFNLGHRNPHVIAALRDALEHLDVGNHHLVSAHRAAAAEKLAATTGGTLPGVVFAVGGSEANEIAVKIARGLTRRSKIVTARDAFHGATGLTIAMGPQQLRERYLVDLADFVSVPFNDLAAMESAVEDDTAAVVLESIPATQGFPPPAPGYLRGVQDVCRRRGALLVLDEVQTGLGRTGTFWYYEQEGVQPDAVVTGKGLSGGIYPISAVLVAPGPFAWFTEDYASHVASFGGSELGCVVASTVVDMSSDPAFLAHVRSLAERFRRGLVGAPFSLRQRGLTMAFDFGTEGAAFGAWKQLLDNGVLGWPSFLDTAVLQFKPPLILTEDEADEIVSIVRRTFG